MQFTDIWSEEAPDGEYWSHITIYGYKELSCSNLYTLFDFQSKIKVKNALSKN